MRGCPTGTWLKSLTQPCTLGTPAPFWCRAFFASGETVRDENFSGAPSSSKSANFTDRAVLTRRCRREVAKLGTLHLPQLQPCIGMTPSLAGLFLSQARSPGERGRCKPRARQWGAPGGGGGPPDGGAVNGVEIEVTPLIAGFCGVSKCPQHARGCGRACRELRLGDCAGPKARHSLREAQLVELGKFRYLWVSKFFLMEIDHPRPDASIDMA